MLTACITLIVTYIGPVVEPGDVTDTYMENVPGFVHTRRHITTVTENLTRLTIFFRPHD